MSLYSCLMMTSVIWLVQLTHYPSFKFIDKKDFLTFHQFHSSSITFIVFPLMLIELLSTGYLLLTLKNSFWAINFLLVILTWLSTLLVSIPIHSKLSKEKNEKIIKSLVITNWPRTIFWSLRSIILLWSINV